MGDNYNYEQASNRDRLQRVIPNRLSELDRVLWDRKLENDWYVLLISKILTSVARVCRDLLQTVNQRGALPAAAWNARNLLELWVWIEYCSTSRENARRFHDDALRDILGLTDSLCKISELDGIKIELEASAREKLANVALKELGTKSLTSKFKKVSAAAEQVEKDNIYHPHNNHLSKFAHPTALLVIGLMQHPETVLGLQVGCTTIGVNFADQCVTALERAVSEIN